jgi:hypothetical protein
MEKDREKKEKEKKRINIKIADVAASEGGRVGTRKCGGEGRTHNTRHTLQDQASGRVIHMMGGSKRKMKVKCNTNLSAVL